MTAFAPSLFAIGCVVVGCEPGRGLVAAGDEGPGIVDVMAAESAEPPETEGSSADTGLSVVVETEASEVAAETEASEVAAETEASEVAAETEASETAASEVAAETALAEAEVGPDAVPPSGTAYGAPIALGALSGAPETSGIVASRDHPGIFWIHNDSGNPAELLAIDTTPRVVATFALPDAQNQDWEAIALLPRAGVDTLYIGDVGDNVARITEGVASGRLGTIRLYRLDEPDPTSQDPVAAPEPIDLTYPDGPHDCESLFVDGASGDVYLFSKVRAGNATLYVARAPLVGPGPIALTSVATLDMGWITAADLAADGTRLAVRNYSEIRVFAIAGSIPDALATTPWKPSTEGSAAEAIAFGAGSYDLYTIAEGEGAALFRIPWE